MYSCEGLASKVKSQIAQNDHKFFSRFSFFCTTEIKLNTYILYSQTHEEKFIILLWEIEGLGEFFIGSSND